MRLDFNILWVEDQKERVESQEEKIARALRKEGFKLQTQFADSIESARQFISSDIFGDHIDLILMDYDLGKGPDGPNGGDGVTEVRSKFAYKDVVFYSADVSLLLKTVAEKRLQGVFCSNRTELPDNVIGVFDTLVKKVLDIDHSRGIVMGATSEIDYFVNQSLLEAFQHGDDGLRTEALKIVEEQMAEICKSFEKEVSKIKSAQHVSELLEHHYVYSSAHRLRLLRKILEKKGSHEAECAKMLTYSKETVPKRNALAHLQVQRDGFARKLFDRKGVELTIDDMKNLRIALLDHHESFEQIVSSLKPSVGRTE